MASSLKIKFEKFFATSAATAISTPHQQAKSRGEGRKKKKIRGKRKRGKSRTPEDVRKTESGRESSERNASKRSKSKRRERKQAKQVLTHPFRTEFGDHFATSASALAHIAPILRFVRSWKKRLTVYDPFYCDGSVKARLHRLGFEDVVHENRDFYADVATGHVPSHDVLVTNPPYSSSHKSRILDFCVRKNQRRPWALLVPTYCVNKQWYKDTLRSQETSSMPFYIIPTTKYEYEHPTGRGHDTSPFESCWIVSAWERTDELFSWYESNHSCTDINVFRNIDALRRQKIVSSKRRPNPRARRKRRSLYTKQAVPS